MAQSVEYLIGLFLLLMWFAGIALAESLGSILLAIAFPPFAIYLTVERFLIFVGWVV